MVNMPVSDSVAIRASGFYRNVGGFIDSIGTGGSDVADNINAFDRIWRPRVDAHRAERNLLIAADRDVQDIENEASSGVDSDYTTGETLYGGLTQSQFVPELADVSYRVYNATATWDLGFGDLTSSTSYGSNTQEFRVDFTTLLRN